VLHYNLEIYAFVYLLITSIIQVTSTAVGCCEADRGESNKPDESQETQKDRLHE
jgi:hypothetical protein